MSVCFLFRVVWNKEFVVLYVLWRGVVHPLKFWFLFSYVMFPLLFFMTKVIKKKLCIEIKTYFQLIIRQFNNIIIGN